MAADSHRCLPFAVFPAIAVFLYLPHLTIGKPDDLFLSFDLIRLLVPAETESSSIYQSIKVLPIAHFMHLAVRAGANGFLKPKELS